MKRALITISTLMTLNLCPPMNGQGLQQELQKKLATVKESVARNQASLRKYTWTEQTEILYKGEVKKTQQYLCRYGPDGEGSKDSARPAGSGKAQARPKGKDRRRED